MTNADVSPDPWASRLATPWHGDGTQALADAIERILGVRPPDVRPDAAAAADRPGD